MLNNAEIEKLLSQGTYTALGYRSANYARTNQNITGINTSGDYELRYDLMTLRNASRQMYQDNGLYATVINRLIDNVLGQGFKLQAHTGDKDLNDKLEDLWEEFCLAPEISDKFSWWECERLAFSHTLIDGDFCALKLASGQLQLIEPNRLGNASRSNTDGNVIELGVEINKQGKPLAFHISDYIAYGSTAGIGATPYKADDVIFLANRDRVSQTRGVPKLQSVMPFFWMIFDVLGSEATSAQIQSKFALAITRQDGATQAYNESLPDPASTDQSILPQRVQQFSTATIFQGLPGESIQSIERKIPGPNFEESIRVFVRLLGTPVGLPLELILLDMNGLNFSSARANLMQAYKAFSVQQRFLKDKFHSKVYRWKVQQWIDAKLIPELPNIFTHTFTTPSFPWIDPIKEANAVETQLKIGVTSLQEVLASLNKDPQQVLSQIKSGVVDAIKISQEIKEETGVDVPWQNFAGGIATLGRGESLEGAPNATKPDETDNEDINDNDDEDENTDDVEETDEDDEVKDDAGQE